MAISKSTGILAVVTTVALVAAFISFRQAHYWRQAAGKQEDELGRLRARVPRAPVQTAQVAQPAAKRSTSENTGKTSEPTRGAFASNGEAVAYLLKNSSLSVKGSFFRSNGTLGRDFQTLLNLEGAQIARLERAMAEATDAIGALSEQHAVVKENTKDRLIIEVQSHAEQGTTVYKQLLDRFTAEIGPERQGTLLKVAGDQFDRALSNFGANTLTFTVTKDPSGSGYEISFDRSGPDGRGGGRQTVPDLTTFVTSYGPGARPLLKYMAPSSGSRP